MGKEANNEAIVLSDKEEDFIAEAICTYADQFTFRIGDEEIALIKSLSKKIFGIRTEFNDDDEEEVSTHE